MSEKFIAGSWNYSTPDMYKHCSRLRRFIRAAKIYGLRVPTWINSNWSGFYICWGRFRIDYSIWTNQWYSRIIGEAGLQKTQIYPTPKGMRTIREALHAR